MSAVVIDLNDVMPPRITRQRFDLDLIVHRLRDTAEQWVPRLFPNGRRVGNDWRLANIRGDAPRKSGSCVIALKGAHAGDWIDFDGNQGGGPLSTLEAALDLKGYDLIVEAAEMTGVRSGAPPRQPPTPKPAPVKRDTQQDIDQILALTGPAADTPVSAYLNGRGLSLPPGADLGCHPNLMYWETRTRYPAMVAIVRDRDGAIIGIHRTYLASQPDGRVIKAPVARPKMMLGRIAGGAVRLADPGTGDRLALCEGIETGLAAMAAVPTLPVWATLSTSGLEQIQLPAGIRRVVILADHDASGAGLRAAETAARRLRAEGREVVIARPPLEGDDFNDLLRRDGPEAVTRAISDAQVPAASEGAVEVGQHRPVNFDGTHTHRPQMRADDGDLGRAVDRVWELLMASNSTPWLFRFATQPTWVVPDDAGRPCAAPVTEDRLRYILAKLATWMRETAKGELVPSPPPIAVVKSVLATPDPAIPILSGIVNTPVFGRTGTLLTSPGYHPDARLLYVPAPGFVVPGIPQKPTDADIATARALIVDDLLGDFPFTGPAERAHVVSLLLLGFLRSMIDGPTPLHLIEKPSPGTGATLLVDCIATILTGAGANIMTEGRDEEEWRKRVTAKLRQIPTILLIDNLREKLDSAAVAAALTASFWEDRILGSSEMARLPIRCLWIATGNNPEFSNEMARRLVRIRLDPQVEAPEMRTGFRHPDLMTWVRANRARLVAACLTLCQAWIAAGRPRAIRTIGSYENWAQVMGGVLSVAGIDGFLGNLEHVRKASDSESAAWRGFVSAWWDRFGTAEVITADLFEMAIVSAIDLGGGLEHSRRIRLGKSLGKMRDRRFNIGDRQLQVNCIGTSHQAQRWKLTMKGECSGGKGSVAEKHSPAEAIDFKGRGECGEYGECFPAPYARADAPAHAKEDRAKHSPHSPHSQKTYRSDSYAGECSGECVSDIPPPPLGTPKWLQEEDP